MNIPAKVKQKLQSIDSIATLPNIANEILQLTRHRNTSLQQIASLIEKDPSITAKILKVANSPIWGYSGRIESVQRALVMLGLKQVFNIVISISLYSTFANLKPNPKFDRHKFWMHSVGTGQIARRLSTSIKLNFQGEEFVAGLIHDIGKMILDQYWEKQFVEIIQQAHQNDKPIIEIEGQYLGCTHAELGAFLLHYWNFPKSIVDVVHYHHWPERSTGQKELVAVISLSDELCELWGIGFDEDIKCSVIEDEPAWKILLKTRPQLRKFDFERFAFAINSELMKAELFIQLMSE